MRCKQLDGEEQWNIQKLRGHSECMARCVRWSAIGIGSFGFVVLMIMAALPLFVGFRRLEVPWALLITAGLFVPAVFLLIVSRMAWNYSNVWLGRAGTLEDLGLALKLMGIDPAAPRPLSSEESQQLLRIAEAIVTFQRKFEGELLKGPSLQVKLSPGSIGADSK
jgi:hypothetical protein